MPSNLETIHFGTKESGEVIIDNTLVENVRRITRSILQNILATRKVPIDRETTVEDVSQETLISIANGEIQDIPSLAKKISSMIHGVINKSRNFHTNQDIISDDGRCLLFEGPRGGVYEPAYLKDDEEMEKLGNGMYDQERFQARAVQDVILSNGKYLIGNAYALFEEIDDEFLREFFITRFVLGYSYPRLAEIIRRKENKRFISVQTIREVEAQLAERMNQAAYNDSSISSEKMIVLFSLLNRALLGALEVENGGVSTEHDQEQKLRKLFFTIGKASDSDNFQQAQSDKIPIPSPIVPNKYELPDLFSEGEALVTRGEAIELIKRNLRLFQNKPESFCLNEIQRPYSFQIRKLRKLVNAVESTTGSRSSQKIVAADIAPPSAGKTYMQAILAKASELPFIFVTHSNAIIHGSDGAIWTFLKLFNRDQLGIVNRAHKEFDRLGTLTTFSSFTRQDVLEKIFSPANQNIPFLIFLDEGDLAQTQLRKEALSELKRILKHPIICALSATKEVSDKSLGNMAVISDEMNVAELIRYGKAKHILGLYVKANLSVDSSHLSITHGERYVDFKKLQEQEREIFTSYPVELYLEHHHGQNSIIHCMSVAHAQEVARRLKEHGVSAACISGQSFKEQIQLKEDYIQRDVRVLTSCDYLGRGFSDHGVTQCIIYAKVTSSRTDLYQKVGRGFRPHNQFKILTVYQILPVALENTNFQPVLLSDVIDLQVLNHEQKKKKISIKGVLDEMEKIILDENQLEFIGMIGPQVKDQEGISFLSQKEIEVALDTRDWGYGRRLNQEDIKELFFTIMDGFLEAIGLDKSEVNSARLTKLRWGTYIDINHKDKKFQLSWGTFLTSLVAVYHPDFTRTEAARFRSTGAKIAKEWLCTSQKPSQELIDSWIEEEEKKVRPLELNKKNAERLFSKLIDKFLQIANLDRTKIDSLSTASLDKQTHVEIEIREAKFKISWHSFLTSLVAIYTGLKLGDTYNLWKIGIKIVKEWLHTGKKPSRELVDSWIQEKENEVPLLDLNGGNVDRLFPKIMDKILEAAKIDRTQSDLLSTSNPHMQTTIIEIEDNGIKFKISWAFFLGRMALAHTNIKKSEYSSFRGIGLAITKYWLREGKKPHQKLINSWVEKKLNEIPALKLDKDNIDRLFLPIINKFLEATGLEKSEVNSLTTSNPITNTCVEIMDGKRKVKISWGVFLKALVVIHAGLKRHEAGSFFAIGAQIAKEWLRTGQKPPQKIINTLMQTEIKKRKAGIPMLHLNKDNIDHLFPILTDKFLKVFGETEFSSLATTASLLGTYIETEDKGKKFKVSWRSFLTSLVAIYTNLTKREVASLMALGLRIAKEWVKSGKPSEELVNSWLSERGLTLKLDRDNLDQLFFPIVDKFLKAAGLDRSRCDSLSTSNPPGETLAEIKIKGKKCKISWRLFLASLITIYSGIKKKSSRNFGQASLAIVKKWIKTGKPTQGFVDSLIEKRKNEIPSLKLNRENIKRLFPKIIKKFLKAAQLSEADFDSLSTLSPSLETFIAIKDRHNKSKISWSAFLISVVATCAELKKKEAVNCKSVGLALVKEWLRTNEMPSKEFAENLIRNRETRNRK